MRRAKLFLTILIMTVMSVAVLTACKKHGGNGDASVSPSVTQTEERSDSKLTPTEGTGKEQNSSDASVTEVPGGNVPDGSNTSSQGAQTGTDTTENNTSSEGTGDTGSQTSGGDGSASDDGKGSSDISNSDKQAGETDSDSAGNILSEDTERAQQRKQAWKESFLVWIPEFTDGNFVGTSAADTFDYAYFDGIDRKTVLNYIDILVGAGFSHDIQTIDKNGIIEFSAQNDSLWCVGVRYNEEAEFLDGKANLQIASGFYEDDEDSDENKLTELRSTTMLGYLPEFTAGFIDSHYPEDGGNAYYAVFTGVSIAQVREYVYELVDAGYIYEVEEGDSDGIVWYSAMNEDELICDLVYYDGVMRLGCGS